MTKTAISLFSGAGGMDIGFENAGFRTTVAVEQDASCCETLRTNFPLLQGVGIVILFIRTKIECLL